MRSVRQLPYFAGGRMSLSKVLYSLEGSKSPSDDMFCAWADWLVARCERDLTSRLR